MFPEYLQIYYGVLCFSTVKTLYTLILISTASMVLVQLLLLIQIKLN